MRYSQWEIQLNDLRRSTLDFRLRQKRFSRKGSEILSQLRIEHNAIFREWSARGTTYVHGRRHGFLKISRASKEANFLPPLFQQIPDMSKRQHQWETPRDYKREIQEVIECLNPKHVIAVKPNAGEIAQFLKQTKSPVTSPRIVTTTRIENENSVPQINPEIGILFCEGIAKAAENSTVDYIFNRMDVDGNNRITSLELDTFFRSVGIRIDSHKVADICKYLRDKGDSADSDTPKQFATQTKELMRKYEKSKKAFFFNTHEDMVSESEKYFRRQGFHEAPQDT